jgi:ParB/RepB/Spo0J family partition protein
MRSWNLSNIPPDVRALAEESAKRAGLSLTDWLTRTIHRQKESEAAERDDAGSTAAAAEAAAEVRAKAAARATIHRFLPSPLPLLRDIAVDALNVSRLHGETGLFRGLTGAAASDAPPSDTEMPIIARPAANGDGFEIVTGIPIWQAARSVGRESVSVLVVNLSDHEMIRLILIEILTTARIPAIAEAESFRWLLQRGDVSEDELMEISGRSRQDLRDRIALLSLPAPILERLDDGSLSLEVAQVLVGASYGDAVGRIAIDRGLQVEQVRALVALTNDLGGRIGQSDTGAAERGVGALLGIAVSIDRGDDGTLALRIEGKGDDDDAVYRLQATPAAEE